MKFLPIPTWLPFCGYVLRFLPCPTVFKYRINACSAKVEQRISTDVLFSSRYKVGRVVDLFHSYGQTPRPFLMDFGICIHHYRRSEARSQFSVERLAFRLWSSVSVWLRITAKRLDIFSWLLVRMLLILWAEMCIYYTVFTFLTFNPYNK